MAAMQSGQLQAQGRASGSPTGQETETVLNRLFPGRKIKRVLLVNPPDVPASMFQYDAAKRRKYSNYPPYGLAVLAQNLRQIGVETAILNLNHEILWRCMESSDEGEFDHDEVWQTKLNTGILDFQPDLIGITCMFTMTHTSFHDVCEQISKFGIPLAIGGVHVTNDVERVLDDIPQAHMAFIQEGDVAFTKFVQVANRDIANDELGQVIINGEGTRHRYLQEHQPGSEVMSMIPAHDLLDISDFSRCGVIGNFTFLRPEETRFSTVISNRGCRAACTFCSVRTFNGPGVRQRTVLSVVDELELLQNKYGISHIIWLDDDLLRDHRRAIELFNEMTRKVPKMTWDATNGVIAASCKNDVIEAAAESGCIGLHIGMESGNPEILRQIRKPGTVKSFLEASEVFRKHEQIFSSAFVMLGFPGETMSKIFDTIHVGRQMDLDWYSIQALQPLPNTPIYDDMVAQGLIQDVGSRQVRLSLGAHGKARENEESLDLSSLVSDVTTIPMDAIPTQEQLINVWFYMDYHLNYHRLFTEERPAKIEQQKKKLRDVIDVLYPEHGFALYFLGYLQHKTQGKADLSIVQRLKQQLSASDYWQLRFDAFGLSVNDLTTGNFEGPRQRNVLPEHVTDGVRSAADIARDSL